MSIALKTVGAIAAELPASIPVFEKFGIDYCCHGDLTLSEACQARGLSAEAIATEIQAAAATTPASERDWLHAPLEDLLDHILDRHHAFLRAELPVLQQRLSKTQEAHAATHGESLRQLQETLQPLVEELYAHLHKEEMILFPYIRLLSQARAEGRTPPRAPFGPLENPLRVMRLEHDSAGAALERLRQITDDYSLPADACATYQALYRGLQDLEADLHRHIHLENNILFPRALELEAA